MVTHMTRLKMMSAGVVLAAAVGCVSSTEIPPLAGPSEFGNSVGMTASPNTITQDGVSQSIITLTARDSSGKGLQGEAFRIDPMVDGVVTTYGTLSTRTVVTGSDGKATIIYTAPPGLPGGAILGECKPMPFSPALPGQCVTIAATPIGTNGFQSGTNMTTVDVHLVPMTVITVAGAPLACFTYSPASPKAGEKIIFDGSCSAPQAPATAIVNWYWEWNDGGTPRQHATPFEDNEYLSAGTWFPTLTVTDDLGRKGIISKAVLVGP